MVQLQLRQIEVLPGQMLRLHNISWQDFEAILEELGEHRGTRLTYNQGTLEIMAPLPEHEVNKELIGDLVKILLDEMEMDRECFGSTTFKRQDMAQGVEPDQCFYIQNHALMRGRSRVDLTIDPPPDLAIEVDVTNITQLETYQALGVPELWRYENRQLQIYVLHPDGYVESPVSPTFSSLATLRETIERFVMQSKTDGASTALRVFRAWVKAQIAS